MTPSTLRPGTRLGSYEIVAPLGVGGMGELYVTAFPNTTVKRQVSSGGGSFPKWHGVNELFFVSPAGWLNAVQITVAGSELGSGQQQRLFEIGPANLTNIPTYVPSADGQRFVTRGATATAVPDSRSS